MQAMFDCFQWPRRVLFTSLALMMEIALTRKSRQKSTKAAMVNPYPNEVRVLIISYVLIVLSCFCLLIVHREYGSSQELFTEVDHTSLVEQAEEQGETHDNSLHAVGG